MENNLSEEKKAIRIQFQNILNELINNKIASTGTEILSAEQPMILLFDELMHKIDRLQKENISLKQENDFLKMMYSGTDEFKRIERFANGK